jgi:trehalose-6-phosphate synthase
MGCSRSLSGTIRVNPWAVESVGDAMHTALSMSLEERKANHHRRYNYVMSQSLKAWAHGFVEHLGQAAHSSDNLVFAQVIELVFRAAFFN